MKKDSLLWVGFALLALAIVSGLATAANKALAGPSKDPFPTI